MIEAVAVVLAAGQGKRMHSRLVKVLHPLRGIPLVCHVLAAVAGAGVSRILVVVGVQADQVRGGIDSWGAVRDVKVEYVLQGSPLGTAHAVMVTRPLLEGYRGDILVLNGDTPLIRPDDLRQLVRARREAGAAAAFLTTSPPDPAGYGRVMRDERGNVTAIVEDSDCTPQQREVREVNAGVYCFWAPGLWPVLEQVNRGNAQGEYYLPDVVSGFLAKGEQVVGLPVAWEVGLGINDRCQLAEVDGILRFRFLAALMQAGVTVRDPASAFLSEGVRLGKDVIIEAGTVVEGAVCAAPGARLGPFTLVRQTGEG